MSKMKSHDHAQNQKGWSQPMGKPSPSTSKKVGVTSPISKPSPSTSGVIGVTGPGAMKKGSKC